MSDLTIFAFDSAAVRVVMRDGEPWFVAADLLSTLSLDRKALERLDDDEKGVSSIHTPGGDQEMTVINESGLYSLILGSRKPEAKKFKKWVTSEVLPSIRQTGSYGALPPASAAYSAVDHRADILVSADRTFRAVLRSARATGVRIPDALARANEITVRETGVDMLAQIGPIERPVSNLSDPVAEGIAEWAKQSGDGPYSMAEILRQAFGLEAHARDYGRITVMAANALRAAGFVSRKRRMGGPPRSYWERAA